MQKVQFQSMMNNNEKTVLIVDDVAGNLDVLSGILKNEYRLKIATNGKKAIQIATGSEKPDLILLDIMMPEMDGYEVCRKLKRNHKTKNIPIIFVTALGEIKDEAKGLNLGAVDYITKPVSPPIVKARVRNQLAFQQANKDLDEALQKTLLGSVRILTEILAMTNPTAFSRALRLKSVAGAIARKSGVRAVWKYEVAASLSQLGCIFLPSSLMEKINEGQSLSKDELELYKTYPEKSYKLLSKIPHLEECAEMIRALKLYEHANYFKYEGDEAISTVLLQGVVFYDEQLAKGSSEADAFSSMSGVFPDEIVTGLDQVIKEKEAVTHLDVKLADLEVGMTVAEDLLSDSGSVVIPKSTVLSETIILRLQSNWSERLNQSIKVCN